MKQPLCESCGEIISPTYNGDPDMRLCQECWDEKDTPTEASEE